MPIVGGTSLAARPPVIIAREMRRAQRGAFRLEELFTRVEIATTLGQIGSEPHPN